MTIHHHREVEEVEDHPEEVEEDRQEVEDHPEEVGEDRHNHQEEVDRPIQTHPADSRLA
jgi:hypothetical protein